MTNSPLDDSDNLNSAEPPTVLYAVAPVAVESYLPKDEFLSIDGTPLDIAPTEPSEPPSAEPPSPASPSPEPPQP